MSESIWPQVGACGAQFGDEVDVRRDPANGDVRLALSLRTEPDPGEDPFTWLTPMQLATLRELLDRAAMPGQAVPGGA